MNKFSTSIILIMLGIVYYLLFLSVSPSNSTLLKISILIVCIVCLIFVYVQQITKFKSFWYKPSNVFLLSYLIVNFQYVVDFLIGFKNYSDFYLPQTINKATYVCVLGLIAYVVGYVVSTCGTLCDTKRYDYYIPVRFLVILQFLLFSAWIATVNVVALIAGYNYFEESGGSASANFEGLFYCSTIAIFAVEVSNSKCVKIKSLSDFIKQGPILSWIVIGLYILIRLVSGDRGPALYMLLAMFFAYIMSRRHVLDVKKIVLPAIFLAFILNIVGMARSMDLNQSFSDRAVSAVTDLAHSRESRFSNKTIIPITEELAMSSRCNQIAVELVDNNNHSLHYGKYLWYQIIQCVPFVPSILSNYLKIPSDELSSNILLTDFYYGQHELAQIGTTIVSDSYLDFGLIGVILVLFFVGYCYKKIDYMACFSIPNNWILIILVLLLSSMAIYIPRSTFIIQLKQLIPTVVIYYVNLQFSNKYKVNA